MATIKMLLKKNKQKANGEYPLYMRITEKGKPKYISVGISLLEKQWDEHKELVKSHSSKTRFNAKISQLLSNARNTSIDQELKGKTVTSSTIKNSIIGKSPSSLSQYFEKYLVELESKEKIGTLDKAGAVYRKFKKYNRDANIDFIQMNYDFIERYESYLRIELGNSTNTIHSNLKIFRMLFNRAEKQGIIDHDQNPFHQYVLKTEKTTKEYLSKVELSSLVKLVIPKGSRLDHCRNIFIFASYAGGIRVSDILQFKWKNFNETHISITMQKTTEQISVKLPNKALEIIELYREVETVSEHYIFPFLRNEHPYTAIELYKAIKSKTALVNKGLKEIARRANIEKRVSFHTSRHTYATLALSLGMPIEYVSKLMGHSNIKVTQQYAKLINKDLDDAMDVFNNM